MKIGYTRAMITAALGGQLDRTQYRKHPIFNVDVPAAIAGVPGDVLDPRSTWADKAAYDEQAGKLARMFIENFKTFAADVSSAVKDAGPQING
jgi:phosphoenolpyruvate carboxykinase (ATP)